MAVAVRAFLGYLFLLLTVRVLSLRPGGQMTLFELVIVFLIGGVIILSTVGNDRSVTNCATAVLTVGLMHRTVTWLKSRSPGIGAIVDGTLLVLAKDGERQTATMRGMRLDPEDVMAAGRTKGVRSIFQIKYAMLERNGSISIIKADGK